MGGAAFCAVAAVAAFWSVPQLDLDRLLQRDAAVAGTTFETALLDPGLRLANLLPPPLAEPVSPLRPDFHPPADSSFTLHGVRYDDPTGGAVPLEWLADRADRWVTPGFRLADFMARDGAPLARISPELVAGLERMRRRAGHIVILSGYRHPTHNARVGGAGDSQHQAGKAADIASSTHSPVDLALLALDEIGCNVGLGLGPTSLHVDVRGELKTWTYPGASMSNPAFATWVHTLCGLPVPTDLVQRAEAIWLTESDPDEEGMIPQYASSSPAPRTDVLSMNEDAIVSTARAAYPTVGAGAVVLDLRAGTAAPPRYIGAASGEVGALQLDALVAFCRAREELGYFAYAILTDGQAPLTGVMSLAQVGAPAPARTAPSSRLRIDQAPVAAPPSPAPAGPATVAPTPQPSSPPPPARAAAASGERWGVVLASLPDAAGAEATLALHRGRLGPAVPLRVETGDGRYRVIIGPFTSRGAAQDAMIGLDTRIPHDAWLAELEG
jgi:cell division septation protein DedD